MTHKRTQRQLLDNVILDGRTIIPSLPPSVQGISSLANARSKAGLILPHYIEFTATDQEFTVTDSGGAGGGNFSQQLFTFPTTERIAVVSSYLSVEVKGIGTGIADGTFAFGVGTAVASAALDGAEINWLSAALSRTVSSGVAAKGAATGPLVITYLDASAGTLPLYFNGYVPDASISATGVITLDVVFRGIYFDCSLGDTV